MFIEFVPGRPSWTRLRAPSPWRPAPRTAWPLTRWPPPAWPGRCSCGQPARRFCRAAVGRSSCSRWWTTGTTWASRAFGAGTARSTARTFLIPCPEEGARRGDQWVWFDKTEFRWRVFARLWYHALKATNNFVWQNWVPMASETRVGMYAGRMQVNGYGGR